MFKSLYRLIFLTIISFIYLDDSLNTVNLDIPNTNVEEELLVDDNLFDQLLIESKLFYADAIMADLRNDTLNTLFNFDNLFKALAQLEEISKNVPEIAKLKYQNILSASIEYYDNKVTSIDHTQTGFSTAVFKDKLEDYIYSQSLDDIVDIEETVEIIEGHVPITYNRKVASIIRYYQNQGKPHIQQWLNREDKFKEIILPILKEEGVPPEVFYVAMVESGLKTDAKSYAAAVGPWQFIASTGKVFGLKKTYYVDERRDFEKSTRAACKYLKNLYKEFGDWYLAFAAYNCGETRVRRHISYFKTNNFWELTNLPKETQNYIPSILAIIFISKDPEKYGFNVKPEPFFDWTLKEINKSVSIDDIARCSKIDKKILIDYNPELLKNFIYVEEGKKYNFRMPITCHKDFDSLFTKVKDAKTNKVLIVNHRVKRGESFWYLAKKNGTTITAICELNSLDRNKPLRVGKMIKIPVGLKNYKAKPKKQVYIVKYGDTLSEIAEQYKVKLSKLKSWNKIKSNNIRVGQKLVIYK